MGKTKKGLKRAVIFNLLNNPQKETKKIDLHTYTYNTSLFYYSI